MAKGKLLQSEANVHRLLNDKDAMKLAEDRIQELVEAEYEKHMGRKPHERGMDRSLHRNGIRERYTIWRKDIRRDCALRLIGPI